jgi:hypothetical protein
VPAQKPQSKPYRVASQHLPQRNDFQTMHATQLGLSFNIRQVSVISWPLTLIYLGRVAKDRGGNVHHMQAHKPGWSYFLTVVFPLHVGALHYQYGNADEALNYQHIIVVSLLFITRRKALGILITNTWLTRCGELCLLWPQSHQVLKSTTRSLRLKRRSSSC